ncbi:expressed unknown protein [Seminavis robusta]|uniref:Helicase-associated domain-containing protein n=1 Tax=Seminavis robusta TaxID=568900 RepID=A0A9N8EEM2_9STRA|nr:expressed unknown protein [Seminavis robusta]|eukprot:Sro965_g225600.1 n/a (267) ;mRNA; f:19765-20565
MTRLMAVLGGFPMALQLLLCLHLTTGFVIPSPSFVIGVPSSDWCTSTILWSAKSDSVVPDVITTKVLAQLYPALMEHKAQYGNPNIPLGTSEGRQCNVIRRMQVQEKLTASEVELLKELGFIFHALEDVYEHVDFEEMFPRLEVYKQQHDGSVDIPKKYAPDPELGAWVTGIRRLGKDRVDPDHVNRLDQVGFVWVSTRKCGSKFMEQYRKIQQRLQDENDPAVVWEDEDVVKFVRAQKEAFKRNTLSETRVEYMTRLLGEEWWTE